MEWDMLLLLFKSWVNEWPMGPRHHALAHLAQALGTSADRSWAVATFPHQVFVTLLQVSVVYREAKLRVLLVFTVLWYYWVSRH